MSVPVKGTEKENGGSIRIGRKAIVLSYTRYILTTFSNIIILPVILTHISQEEYGLWSIFLSIDAGIVLIEVGLGSVITRYVTYAYCGADDIPLEGLPVIREDGKSNPQLLFNVVYVARAIYRKIAIISAGLFLAATAYVVYLALQLDSLENALLGWFIFCVGSVFRILFTYYSSFIKGIGKIKEVERIQIFLTVLYMVTRMSFTAMGWGLVGLGVANAIDVILGRFLIYFSLKGYIHINQDAVKTAKIRTREGKNTTIKDVIWRNSRQMGIVTITDYITGQGKSLLCSVFLPLTIMGQFSLTNQIVSAVASMSMIPFNTFRIQLGDAIVKQDREKTHEILTFILMMFLGIMTAGSIVTLMFGGRSISLIKSNTSLLENRYVFLLLLYTFILQLNRVCTGYIALKNKQIFIRSYVVASAGGIIIAYLSYLVTRADGLACYIYSILGAQLVYNAWKWPLYVCRDTGIRVRDIPVKGIKYLIKVIKGTN